LDADLNLDGIVNFGDFAILANYWQQSTSGPEDFDGSGFVDYNDVSILAEQWLWITGPNIQLQIYGDANNGFVEFGATGYTSDTQRIFLLMDGQYVGEIYGFREGWPLGIDVSEYGGGEKQFKAVSINSAGKVTCSNITNADFNCPLNYCFLPSRYEPNKPLYFSAFNPAESNVTVNVYADDGNLVWSQNYSGNNILGFIPAEITRQYEFDYINFDTGGGGYVGKVSDPGKPDIPHNVKALIILPNLHIRLFDHRTISAIKKAFKNRGIKYETLSGWFANHDLIALYAVTNPIKYMYIGAHGGDGKILIPETGSYYYEFDRGIRRTWVELSDGRCVSIKISDDGAPPWCQHLGYWEDRSKSFASMGFTTLEFAYFDSCHSGRLKIDSHDQLIEGQTGQQGLFDVPHSDMSFALGMRESSRDRFYQGWWNEPNVGMPWPFEEDEYRKWTQLEWEKLGEGDSLYDALTYVIDQYFLNHQTEYEDPNAPVNNYRIKGQGHIWELFLSDN
jgi:hypothetical protein